MGGVAPRTLRLSGEYVRFLDDNGITPDAFEKLPDTGDDRAAYVMLRMRQTHDLREAFARGNRTGYLPTFRWEDHWTTPVAELRALLTCPPAEVFQPAA